MSAGYLNSFVGRCMLALALALLGIVPAHAQYVEYIHTDALGTPVTVTDQARHVVEHHQYEPFGKLLNEPVTDGPAFTGHVADAATGLDYMQQRYYDPGIGRFLSVDPVTADSNTGANFNSYWYANNNPYSFTDPDGRQTCTGSMLGCPSQTQIVQLSPPSSSSANSSVPAAPQPGASTPTPQPASFGDKIADAANHAFEFLTDEMLPALGPPEAEAGKGLQLLGAGVLSVRLGVAGELAVREAYNIGPRGFFAINGRLRISDGLNRTLGTLSEVKNVRSLSFSRQLRDYAQFAKDQKLRFDLYVRPGTQLSAPLQAAIRAGDINLRAIP